MSDRDQHLRQAIARWQHLPTDTERQRDAKKRKVMKTLAQIEKEADLLTVRLPSLSPEQKLELWDEAVYDVCSEWVEHGGDVESDELLLMDEATAIRFEQLSVIARVELSQQRGGGAAGKLWTRRATRRIQEDR